MAATPRQVIFGTGAIGLATLDALRRRGEPVRLVNRSGSAPVPDDVEIVLYCSSRRDIVSARAAVALKRIGVDNVWVLEGGLDSWREEGLPLSQFPEAPGASTNCGSDSVRVTIPIPAAPSPRWLT